MMLEQFYQSLYHELFYHWIVSNESKYANDSIHLEKQSIADKCEILIFHMHNVYGKVTIWSHNIVEEEIHQKQNDQLLFYLHFTIVNIAQASQLFLKFYQTLIHEDQKKDYQIALCCTGGFSTALFVEKMQEVCDLENAHLQLSSLSLEKLYQTYDQYDAIYLAPQISYMRPKLMLLVKNQIPIHCIDATDFATGNYQHIIKKIQSDLN